MTARLCLNMIVRNEALIIERALASVVDHIDCWAIVDTGSTDDTKAVIAAFFAERGLPGGFLDHPFDGFDRARNRALDFARQSGFAFDYLLVMDADMQLRVDDPAFRDTLTASAYTVRQHAGISYWNVRLLRHDAVSLYRGITHEYLDHPHPIDRLTGIWFEDGADGANRAGKFERDAALLLSGLEAEPDNARYVYYLAQSYRDAGQTAKAAETYARRFAMGGWDEECWSALLNEARCRLALGDEAGFVAKAGEALNFRPRRAEPLHDLAVYYRKGGLYEEAMMCCELASHIAYPAGDRLFVEDYVYTTGIRVEMSIAGYYCADPRRKAIGRLACNSLAVDPSVPEDVRQNSLRNLAYYARLAPELMPSWQSRRVEWQPPCAGHPTNPSIVREGGGYTMVVRVLNAETSNGIDFVVPGGGPMLTSNFLMRLDDELQPESVEEILAPLGLPPARFPLVLGFEDLRLVIWRGGLWSISTSRELNEPGTCQMVLARIEASPGEPLRLTDWHVIPSPKPRRHEKNWMPFVEGDALRFIYASDPVTILDTDGRTVRETAPAMALDQLRGGSQPIPFDGGWLTITHEVYFVEVARVYLHRFVWYDADMRLKQFSEAFILHGRGIEFVAGLCWHKDGERLVISYGVGDLHPWLATVSAQDVREAIRSMAPSE